MAIDEVELGERKDPVTVERRLEREVGIRCEQTTPRRVTGSA
jgi:hypothetical protein